LYRDEGNSARRRRISAILQQLGSRALGRRPATVQCRRSHASNHTISSNGNANMNPSPPAISARNTQSFPVCRRGSPRCRVSSR